MKRILKMVLPVNYCWLWGNTQIRPVNLPFLHRCGWLEAWIQLYTVVDNSRFEPSDCESFFSLSRCCPLVLQHVMQVPELGKWKHGSGSVPMDIVRGQEASLYTILSLIGTSHFQGSKKLSDISLDFQTQVSRDYIYQPTNALALIVQTQAARG